MYSIRQLTIKEILEDSPYILETIEKALVECAMPGWEAHDVLQHAIADPTNFHIWSVDSLGGTVAFFATRIYSYPNHTALNVFALANVKGCTDIMKYYLDLTPDLEKIAKEAGIDKIEIVGRKGWTKIHTDYKLDYTVISKEI